MPGSGFQVQVDPAVHVRHPGVVPLGGDGPTAHRHAAIAAEDGPDR